MPAGLSWVEIGDGRPDHGCDLGEDLGGDVSQFW